MKIAIITNIRDQKGLYRDSVILTKLLQSWGHEVHSFDFRDFAPGYHQLPRDYMFTCCIHLEVIAPRAFSWSDKQLYFVNPDWLTRERMQWLDAFRVVLAKSMEGERVLLEAGVKRVVYVGFESEDRMLEGVKRERVFFHSWSQNIMKGTKSVLRAWDLKPPGERYPSSFLIGSKLGEDAYRREQNRCLYWIQPSACEGYGHIIHEGLSCGAIVATLDAPPMNESVGVYNIQCRRVSRQNLADVYEARPEEIARVADLMWDLKASTRLVRASYLEAREAFRRRFRDVLEGM